MVWFFSMLTNRGSLREPAKGSSLVRSIPTTKLARLVSAVALMT
jgi:hypothetical protein